MNFISRRVRGVLDYVVGAILVLLPMLLGFEGAARGVPMVLGLATLFYSVSTDYETGLLKRLSFRAHLALEIAEVVVTRPAARGPAIAPVTQP